MLHSGNHMGSWRAARRPAEHDSTYTRTFPMQENCLHELHWPWRRNKGILYDVAYNHQVPQGQMYANMINEKLHRHDPLAAGNHMGITLLDVSGNREDCKGLLV